MKRFLSVALLAALLAGCAHDSPCVPVYDDQGRLVHKYLYEGHYRITGKQQVRLLVAPRQSLA